LRRGYRTREWPPAWVEAASVAVLLCGLPALFFVLNTSGAAAEATGAQVAWSLALVPVMLLARELAVLSVMRRFGARPRLRPRVQFRPALHTALLAEGHRFSARQFAAVAAWPVVAAGAAGVLLLQFIPAGAIGVHLLAAYLLSETRTLWVFFSALLFEEGTLVEQSRDGAFVHEPAR
jgi:hypothetical protein